VLADSTGDLVDEANRNYDQTVALLNNVGPLLDTQVRTAGRVRSYFADLAGFTRVLRDNDRHLRRGIRGVGPAGRLANRFIEDNENTVPILTSNMRTLGQVLGVYRPSVEQVLVSYPLVIAWEQIVARNHRGIHAAFEREVHEVCSTGFDPGSTRSADAMADAPATPNAYCKVPHNDPRDVRGARNVPCLEGHVGLRAGTVDECFGREPRPNGPAAQTDNAPFLAPNAPIPPASFPDTGPFSGSGSGSGSASASGFGSGFGSGSGDPLSMLGAMGTPPAGKDSSWRSMLMAPLAH
jgi:phospholipid/cholesterol/gamma-HCH transport system substrate-binding protein